MGWDESVDKFILGTTLASGTTSGDISITTGTVVVNVEGDLTGNVTAITVTDGIATLTDGRLNATTITDGTASLSSGMLTGNVTGMVTGDLTGLSLIHI